MARKLNYNEKRHTTFMKENVAGVSPIAARWCTLCKKRTKTLYYYWEEPDIGGDDRAPRHALPFCCIEHYRKYNGDK